MKADRSAGSARRSRQRGNQVGKPAHQDLHEWGKPNAVTAMLDAQMLVTCGGGRERSPKQVHELMRDAGLIPGRVRHFGPTMLVEAYAP